MHLEVIKETPSEITRPNPILFIHGMWHAAWCWAEYFLPYFTQHGYSTYAISLRGHGSSEGKKSLRWSSLDDYVADVAHVVNQMEKPPILVGHSMGGMIIQKYLEKNNIPAAVLLAPIPPGGVLATTARTLLRHPLPVIKSSLTLSMSPIVSTPELAQEAFFSATMPKERVMDYFSRLQDESFRAYLDMLALNLPHVSRTDSPLLVLGAKNDRMISTKEVEATARAYGVEATLFAGMAHDMMLEDRWREVADRILDWLDEHDL
jgi:alpha-beta hydrolase superfamily lysophospholipase